MLAVSTPVKVLVTLNGATYSPGIAIVLATPFTVISLILCTPSNSPAFCILASSPRVSVVVSKSVVTIKPSVLPIVKFAVDTLLLTVASSIVNVVVEDSLVVYIILFS